MEKSRNRVMKRITTTLILSLLLIHIILVSCGSEREPVSLVLDIPSVGDVGQAALSTSCSFEHSAPPPAEVTATLRCHGGVYDQLSDLGKIQAEVLGWDLSSKNFQVDHAYSGTLNRHRQTAELVVEEYQKAGIEFPEIKEDVGFNEIDSLRILTQISARMMEEDPEVNDLVMRSKAAFKENAADKIRLFNITYKMIMDAWIGEKYPDFEGVTWRDYCSGVLNTLEELRQFERDERIVVFTSGNPMGIFVKDALGLTDDKVMEIVDYLYNTNITSFLIKDDALVLMTMNETPHLSDDQRTRR